MLSNEKVVRLWSIGKKARNRNMRTDGVRIWSYNLLIGIRNRKGLKLSFSYRSKDLGFISSTTSRHCGLVNSYANCVITDGKMLKKVLKGI